MKSDALFMLIGFKSDRPSFIVASCSSLRAKNRRFQRERRPDCAKTERLFWRENFESAVSLFLLSPSSCSLPCLIDNADLSYQSTDGETLAQIHGGTHDIYDDIINTSSWDNH